MRLMKPAIGLLAVGILGLGATGAAAMGSQYGEPAPQATPTCSPTGDQTPDQDRLRLGDGTTSDQLRDQDRDRLQDADCLATATPSPTSTAAVQALTQTRAQVQAETQTRATEQIRVETRSQDERGTRLLRRVLGQRRPGPRPGPFRGLRPLPHGRPAPQR